MKENLDDIDFISCEIAYVGFDGKMPLLFSHDLDQIQLSKILEKSGLGMSFASDNGHQILNSGYLAMEISNLRNTEF